MALDVHRAIPGGRIRRGGLPRHGRTGNEIVVQVVAQRGAKGVLLPLRFNRLEDQMRSRCVLLGCVQEMVPEEEDFSPPRDSLQFQRIDEIPAEIRHPVPGLDDIRRLSPARELS